MRKWKQASFQIFMHTCISGSKSESGTILHKLKDVGVELLSLRDFRVSEWVFRPKSNDSPWTFCSVLVFSDISVEKATEAMAITFGRWYHEPINPVSCDCHISICKYYTNIARRAWRGLDWPVISSVANAWNDYSFSNGNRPVVPIRLVLHCCSFLQSKLINF